ncbi:hypothetical protein M9Y10_027926 [Tritrichomonas musculus]|uniref:Guanylate cyclase domain-containing protein n=1 Tax=Tritrichomonas musculus TaxID=1915356 RepID=A0ABR2H6L9_9EUKA
MNIIIYIIGTFSVFFKGGFIQLFISNFVLSSSITGAVFTAVHMICIAIDINGSLAIFFIFVCFFILMLIVCFFILQNREMNRLKLLDQIYEDNTLFSYIRTVNQFWQVATCAIKHAHPLVIELNLFKLAIDKWPNEPHVYFIYAKFIAIYPEESITLKYIYQSVKIQKLSGSTVRCIRDETRSILKQREPGLSSELRRKINQIKKQNTSTRHKLGHAWDVVIRGNMNEIEIATKRAIEAIDEENADFKHLLHEYPNNRNVTYLYSSFLEQLMADHQLSKEMHEKTKLLHPGVIIFEDQTHTYGLKMFPNLPSSINLPKEGGMMTSTLELAQSMIPTRNEPKEDFEGDKEMEQMISIKKNIDEVAIPSIVGTKIIEVFLMLVIFIIPFIIGIIISEVFINDMQKSLTFIGSLSMLRTYAYQIIAFSLRYVGEGLSIFRKFPPPNKDPPRTFGYSWDTKKQFEFLLQTTTDALQDFGAFRKFKENNKYIDKARSLIFENTVNYDYYLSPTNVTSTNTSIQGAILDFAIQQKIIMTSSEINPSILSSGSILNPINNIHPIAVNIRDTMDLLIENINDKYEKSKKIGKIVLIVIIIFDIAIYVVALLGELKWINSNKRETYKCLFSIPKKVISQLDENRYTVKKNNQAEEMNKQDDNILKIFNSGGSYDGSASNIAMLTVETILIVGFAIACLFFIISLIVKSAEIVKNQAAHLHYFQAAYSMLLSSMNYFNIILYIASGHPIPTLDFNYSINRMQVVMNRSRYYFHMVTTGGETNEEIPFKGYIKGVKDASPKNCSYFDFNTEAQSLLLHLKDHRKKSVKSNFNSLTTVLECSPVDMTFTLIEPILTYSLLPYQTGHMENLDPKSSTYETIWIQLISPLYDLFFEPLHNQIIPSISNEIKDLKSRYIPVISVLFVVGVLIESSVYYQAIQIENYIRSVLRLLLHCKPSVIYSSNKIMRVLSGDFSYQQSDSLDRNNSFFDTVFTSLPDAIMIANSDMIIQSANKACNHTFGDVSLVGKSIRDFFMSNQFCGNIETLFSLVNSNPTEEIAYKKDGNSDVKILKASSMIACGKFIMCCKNVTQSHNYNTLIQEEKQNSDKLLNSILPPSLVTRVQEGEKNISFSVQSASILFADIVNFTPWCGSLPAEKVMSTLNILFKRFDSILDKKPTMTKIKCIGDCYMAAGGIFAQINQPSVHAKEVVSFGLLAIKEILLINDEIQQNLNIRVGVNTGGPVVAGVLGIGKPTFEIIGPAINRAQQMEQNGVPMKVHISMSVYQLICGLNFKFGQRRSIECKNEMVETYLVEP